MSERQPREHAVLCISCMRRMTWEIDALCESCKPEPESEPCPWCGEDTRLQGGLEAHISEPCDPYLMELGQTCRDCDKPLHNPDATYCEMHQR